MNDATQVDGSANGLVFEGGTIEAMRDALVRALTTYRDGERWHRLQLNGMRRDFSWQNSAQTDEQLYREAIADLHNY